MKYFSLSFLLAFVFIALSCNTDYRNRNNQIQTKSSLNENNSVAAVKIQVKPTINVFIDNSGSMNGYIKEGSWFKDALRDLLVLLKFHYDEKNIKIYFINSSPTLQHITSNLTDFPSCINSSNFSSGQVESSNLNAIFKQVLDRTTKSNISILLSDCIYSIKGQNTNDLLDQAKSLTKDVFLSKSKTGFQATTTFVKLNSIFDGTYWDKNDKPIHNLRKNRPYYICVIGENELMEDFNSKISFDEKSIKGFENKSVLTSKNFSKDRYFSVLTSTYANGRFKPIKGLFNSTYVQGIENVKINSRNNLPFTFAIALDLKDLPVDDAYLTDTSKYQIKEGNFMIERVEKIEKKNIEAPDWVRIQNSGATHLIVLKAKNSALSDITIAVKKQLPRWISETEPKSGEPEYKEGKTLGFEYLVKGIAEAYQTLTPEEKNYLSITVPIRKSSDSLLGKFIMISFILIAIGSIFLIVIKNRKR